MNQTPLQLPSRHSQYEPFPWIFWIRIAQIVLTVLVIILTAVAVSQSYVALGLAFTFWTISWSLIWVPLAIWFIPRIPANYRPNIIVLIFECLSVLWWLIAFALLALVAASWAAFTVLFSDSSYGYRLAVRSYGYSSSSSSSYDTSTEINIFGNFHTALSAAEAATAFAAVNWILFIVTFVSACVKIHRQRRERINEIYNGNPNNPNNPNNVNGIPLETDKQAQVTTIQTQV